MSALCNPVFAYSGPCSLKMAEILSPCSSGECPDFLPIYERALMHLKDELLQGIKTNQVEKVDQATEDFVAFCFVVS